MEKKHPRDIYDYNPLKGNKLHSSEQFHLEQAGCKKKKTRWDI